MATESTETLPGEWSSFQDPGAKLLTTLMFSPKDDPVATAIIDYLTPDDFHSPVTGQIFSIAKQCYDHDMSEFLAFALPGMWGYSRALQPTGWGHKLAIGTD